MVAAPSLFDAPPSFDGATYRPEHDQERLSGQLGRVLEYMLGHGGWRTIAQIASVVGGSESGVSARLRDLRKPKFGGYRVDRKPLGGEKRGLYVYRVRRDA